jgi:hypothetical protein
MAAPTPEHGGNFCEALDNGMMNGLVEVRRRLEGVW